ncbi:type II toxin-antitoxin system RelE/ParE family toxin [Sphingosinicella microcystinivorans]|uniref:type II toxin-antitoxin system RelE/ParE family toxin n=1 Tax=Sphingosinicella microcystinivorans TaxID=335406 RepID=UPI0022F3FA0D|nr:type II toxin-antitoxin system RelE/ParE family toxin [Sphingosinicella microcystinivorans]WBX82851.1 type II toxin-antitoxin system RelE/ParE family toxin [Sphingosinicella microcystinivorans]
MSRAIRLAAAAEADIIDILEQSEADFGLAARQRYERLLATALRDIAERPERPGSAARPEIGSGIRSWHLRQSRERARGPGGPVRRPRHLILYSIIDDATVGVIRILHDAMELQRHIGENSDDPEDV